MGATDTITVLEPRVFPPRADETRTWSVDGPLAGKVVGLRLESAWRSYIAVVEEWEQRFAADATESVGSTPEEYTAFLKAEIARWTRVARAANIQVD